MNILIISKTGSSLALATRIVDEGHNVSFYIAEKDSKVGDGIVSKTKHRMLVSSSGKPMTARLDSLLKETSPSLVIFDAVGLGRVADYITSQRIPVFGGCLWADLLSGDYGLQIMKLAGIVPLVGDAKGINIGCELWWNGRESFLHNWIMEEKQFYPLACAGNVVRTVRKTCRLVVEGVGKIEKVLKKTNYRGPITLHSVISDNKLYGLRWTVCINAIQSLMELYTDDMLSLFYNMATGANAKYFLRVDEHAMTISASVPTNGGIPIEGISDKNAKHIWLGEVMKTYGKLMSTGEKVLCVTARGSSKVSRKDAISEARKRCLRTLSGLAVVQYRADVGMRVPQDSSALKEWF